MSNGIYVHIPFCLSKCAYCDFNSKAGKLYLADDYINTLINEMKPFSGIGADSVYIGGGTPTALSAKQLEKLIIAIKENFNLSDDAEFTVESNPKTADGEKYRVMRNLGVNRLSIGVQSFDDNELKALSRVHSGYDALCAVEEAKKQGFENLSIDLMEGIPYQSIKSLKSSIEKALSLDVKHISVYSLIIEEGTPFGENPPQLPGEDEEREMYALTREMLEKAGFYHYEISNYAKKSFESRHNTKYWTREPYYGFGAGAHSFYDGVRRSNTDSVEEYISSDNKVTQCIKISEREAEYERFMLGFRMLSGFETNGHFAEKLNRLEKEGLIELKGTKARLTQRGEDLANLVFMEFLGDD